MTDQKDPRNDEDLCGLLRQCLREAIGLKSMSSRTIRPYALAIESLMLKAIDLADAQEGRIERLSEQVKLNDQRRQFEANGVEITGWMDVPGAEYCSMRCIAGTDPNLVANRVAVIEKTPRVRVGAFSGEDDQKNWFSGPKGCAPEYGKYQPSRDWCDRELQHMGYLQADTQVEASRPVENRPRG